MASHIQRILITTGDADGIGTEVTAKALNKMSFPKNFQFVVIRSAKTPASHIKLMSKKLKRIQFDSLNAALLSTEMKSNVLLDVVLNTEPHEWVREAATACVTGRACAMATAPMSKKSIGGRSVGHTEILKDVSKSRAVYMSFLGKEFNVVTCTGHIPLKDVSSQLTSDKLVTACVLLQDFVKALPVKLQKRPLALVGLNPHAGENGAIGNEEQTVYASVVRELRAQNVSFEGPLVPDVAFSKENWKKYSFFVSPYHDLALVPFKLVHGRSSGVHMTLGLPFVRTSVDHGTAKDIFNTNQADPGSMMDALKWAIQLSAAKKPQETK